MGICFLGRTSPWFGTVLIGGVGFLGFLGPGPKFGGGGAGGFWGGLGSRRPTGSRGFYDNLQTSDTLTIAVRTPSDYDPTRAYPLLVVFPPAGYNRRGSEIFYDLTTEATRRGFIVAYSDHLSLSPSAVSQQAKVAATVASFFCVDESSIAYLGHSDGGAMAEGIPVYVPKAGAAPRCVVASAAGMTGICGDAMPVDPGRYDRPQPQR